MLPDILVIIEHHEGRPVQGSLEACNVALELSAAGLGLVRGLAVGLGAEMAAEEIARAWGFECMAAETPDEPLYNAELTLAAVEAALGRHPAGCLLAAGTSQGLDYGPALAAGLGAACISGIISHEPGPQGPCFNRAVGGGKLIATVEPLANLAVLLTQPGAFAKSPPAHAAPATASALALSPLPRRSANLALEQPPDGGSDLGEAQVIVAAGRGLGKPENLPLLDELAGRFRRSAVAGSRPVCDNGWMRYGQQVGITGQTVAPRLYIAAGISGAVQHVSAMSGSGFVVAVNTDAQAAFFNAADVCVVDDLAQFLPALGQAIDKARDRAKGAS